MKKKILAALVASIFTVASTGIFAGSVNLNTADAQTLADNLDGVGMSKANAIVAYRTEHGPFKTVEDVQNVKGIGTGTFESIKSDLNIKEKQSLHRRGLQASFFTSGPFDADIIAVRVDGPAYLKDA